MLTIINATEIFPEIRFFLHDISNYFYWEKQPCHLMQKIKKEIFKPYKWILEKVETYEIQIC